MMRYSCALILMLALSSQGFRLKRKAKDIAEVGLRQEEMVEQDFTEDAYLSEDAEEPSLMQEEVEEQSSLAQAEVEEDADEDEEDADEEIAAQEEDEEQEEQDAEESALLQDEAEEETNESEDEDETEEQAVDTQTNASALMQDTATCSDIRPDHHSCANQKAWGGKCTESWMHGKCCKTCWNCNNPSRGCGSSSSPRRQRTSPSPARHRRTSSSPARRRRTSSSPRPRRTSGGGGSGLKYFLRMGTTRFRCGNSGENSGGASDRRAMKKKIAAGCKKYKCTGPEHAVVVAMAMQESSCMSKSDTGKGTNKPNSNWSPWNMNTDQLNRLGCNLQCAKSIGQYKSNYKVSKALFYLLKGMRGSTIGNVCDMMNFHRYGSTGWNYCKGKGCSCDCYKGGQSKGCKMFKDAQADSTKQILNDKRFLTDGRRVCQKVPWVR